MELRGGILKFYEQAGAKYPVDLKLFQAAVKFADEQLARKLDIARAGQVFVIYVQDGEEIEVLSLGCLQNIVDCFLFRTKPSRFATRATRELWRRMNDFLANAGYEGQEVLLHFDPTEAKEKQCPEAGQWMEKAGARPANRWAVKIR